MIINLKSNKEYIIKQLKINHTKYENELLLPCIPSVISNECTVEKYKDYIEEIKKLKLTDNTLHDIHKRYNEKTSSNKEPINKKTSSNKEPINEKTSSNKEPINEKTSSNKEPNNNKKLKIKLLIKSSLFFSITLLLSMVFDQNRPKQMNKSQFNAYNRRQRNLTSKKIHQTKMSVLPTFEQTSQKNINVSLKNIKKIIRQSWNQDTRTTFKIPNGCNRRSQNKKNTKNTHVKKMQNTRLSRKDFY